MYFCQSGLAFPHTIFIDYHTVSVLKTFSRNAGPDSIGALGFKLQNDWEGTFVK